MQKLANIVLVISSVFIFTGFLFKTMHWPGASISLLFGSLFSLIGMLFYFIARFKNKEDVKVATYSVYFYFFVMVIGTGYYSAISTSRNVLNGFYEVNFQIEKSNQSIMNLISNTNSEGMKLYESIEKHKLSLITGGIPYSSREEVLEIYCAEGIPLNKDNLDIAPQYFIIQDNGYRLVEGLKELRKSYISSLGEDYPHLIEDVEKEKFEYGYSIPWINSLCENLPMIAVLPKLTSIQNQILMCEFAINN